MEKKNIDWGSLGFGYVQTDYRYVSNFKNGAWDDGEITTDPNVVLNECAGVLQYAQTVFEGMKAYKTEDGRTLLFRPEMNAKRFQKSNARLCMPEVPVEDFIQAVADLVKKEEAWIPTQPGTSLYIRPFMFAYQAKLGVHAADHYKFMVILSPVGSYYKEGLKPVSIYVEEELVRAVKGGTGFTKCGGNYAASILAQMKAEAMGYSQVLWLDGIEHKYVEEVGTMNAMFVIDGKIVTAPLDGSLLPGVTRDSMIHLLKSKGYTVEERPLSIDELMDAAKTGKLSEAFGTGTAAVISPIGKLAYKDEVFFDNNKIGPISQMLYDTLTGIQTGKLEDTFGWTYEVK